MFSLRKYFYSLMKDERDDTVDRVVKVLLRGASWAYGLGVRFVDWQYSSGVRKVHKAAAKVVSVGNLTVGGTGKTPFTIFLADHFQKENRKPAVLIRGYGDDEHRMLEDELPDVPVMVGQDRVKNADTAVSKGADVIVLDDGFQHRRIRRDLDVLLVDSVSPTGNGYLLPRGVLREPVSSIRRAGAIVLTKADSLADKDKDHLLRQMKHLAPGVPVALTRHKPVFYTDVTGTVYDLEHLKGKRVCLISGIADPDYFARTVSISGCSIGERLDFSDHHRYTQHDVERIRKIFDRDDIDGR